MKNFPALSSTLGDSNPEAKQEGKDENDSEEEDPARCEWDFTHAAIVSSGTEAETVVADTLGAVDFDPSGDLFVTGGISRKIRIYSLKSLLSHQNIDCGSEVAVLDHSRTCEYFMCTPAKLSSLRWKPQSGGRYDLERRTPVFERDEHGGRRVWSVDYSHWDPVVGASGSDDGTVQMWDPRCDGGSCVAQAQPSGSRSSVCCVEFNPFGGALLAVGCADRRAYAYDVRMMSAPVLVLEGHSKPVTYVRFLDHQTVVTAATDGCLKLWQAGEPRPVRTYRGHSNSRRFVGLSVWRSGGLLGCGSESNQVFVYDKRWGEPIWVHRFGPVAPPEVGSVFVSGVCWRQVGEDDCTLVAGGSDGVLHVLEGKRRRIIS
ncbi:hypothetical protein NMG60_11018128 [Bertholletia excelsa]